MRLIGGYRKQTMEANVKVYLEDGYTEEQAKKFARGIAIKFFRKAKGNKPLPDYLKEAEEQ